MFHKVHIVAALVGLTLVAVSCGGTVEPSPVPIDAQGFPIDWPVATPPGNVNDCANGAVVQEDELFSVVMCLPAEPDPFIASQQYLATLAAEGFAERSPGAFANERETFLDGNGIEIYFQLVDLEATVVLIKPAS